MSKKTVLNKHHIERLASLLEYISLRTFSSPSENSTDEELAQIPESQHLTMNVIGPIIGRAMDNTAKEIKLKPTLRRDELDSLMNEAIKKEVSGFVDNPRNEKILITLSKQIKDGYKNTENMDMYNAIVEEEAAILEEYPDQSISFMAGIAMMVEAYRSYHATFRDVILEQFDTIAKDQKQQEPRGKGGGFKTRKRKSR